MTAAAAKPEHHTVVQFVPIDKIAESPHNHRQKTWGDLDGLADSIKAKGVLQPVLLRPMKGIGSNLFELVFGHRRVRASKAAGLTEVPAMVREMSDVDVVEAQIIENINRADVHPMEEAEGYAQLLAQKERPLTVDDLAAKVGKSKAYVYARMKLLDLCQEARAVFYEGEFSPSVMLLVARIAGKDLQKEALQKLKPDPWSKSPKSLREATDIIHEHFMLRLADAPFERGDAGLLKSAGACTTCPKRSGAQPDLFADVPKKAGDLCTDPTCFKAKKAAWAKRKIAEAEAAGKRVLVGAEAKKAAGRYSGDSSATHVRLDSQCYEDPKYRTYAQLLGKKAPVTLAQMEGGELVEVVDKKAARDLLKEAGHSFRAERAGSSGGDSFAREKKKQALKRLKVRKAIALIVDRAEKRPLDDTFLADALLSMSWHDTAVDICKRRELETGKGKRPEEVLEAFRKKLTPEQVRGLLVETLVTRGAYFAYSIGDADTLKAAAKLYGVDMEKCGAEAKAEIQAKEAEKTAREKARAAKEKKKASPPSKGKKTAGKAAAARDLPRATKEQLAGEACLDCGVAAGKPSPGCDACDHPEAPEPGRPAGELAWQEVDGTHRAEAPGGEYQVLPGSGAQLTWRASWVPKLGPSKSVASSVKLADAKAACARHHLEQLADATLANAGAGALNAKGLKGAAVAPKKGGRRG